MKAKDKVKFITPLGLEMTGTIISVYQNTTTGKQMVSIKVDNPTSSFDTYGIESDFVEVLQESVSEGRLNQLKKSLLHYETQKQELINSGEALTKRGTLNAIEKKIALRKQQIAGLVL